ncbi:hypothetical protein Emed_002090 [Eimeria media]
MAGKSVSQLGSAGVPSQNIALVTGVEKAPENVRLLHPAAQVASMPHQARHRVSRRTLMGAATAYVAILAVALLILVCARRLSTLSFGERRVRALASAGGDEPAGACGGSAEGEEEEENQEEDPAWREALVQQVRENLEGFKEVLGKLSALRDGSNYTAVTCGTSVYILMAAELGGLAAFIDKELLSLRSLWSSVLKGAVDFAAGFHGEWRPDPKQAKVRDAHNMNNQLVELLQVFRTAKEYRSRALEGRRWALLSNLVRVQSEVLALASSYLSAVSPESMNPHSRRRQAMIRLASLSDARRRMIMGSPAFGPYLGAMPSRGFAKKRFGLAAAEAAQKENLPSTPEDQIRFLRDYFPMHLRERAPEAPRAIPVSSASTAAPSKKKKERPQSPKMSLTQLSPPPQQPPEPSQSSHWPPMQPSASSPASGPGPQGVDPFAPLGARPKSYSQVATASGETSSKVPSKKSPVKSSHGGLKDGKPSSGSKAGPPAARLLPSFVLSPQAETPQSSATVLKGSVGLRRRRGPQPDGAKPKDVTPSDKDEGKPSPGGDLEQKLGALALGAEESSTSDED